MELPLIRAYNQEAIVIHGRTDDLDKRPDGNRNGCLMVVFESEHHPRKNQKMFHERPLSVPSALQWPSGEADSLKEG